MANESTGTMDAAPVSEASARFEIYTGDLIDRIELVCSRVEGLREKLEPFGVIEAARRLKNALAEHRHEIADPLGSNSVRLIERQGERIRALTVELETALEGARSRDAVADELAAWKKRHEAVTLRAESAEEIAAYKKRCARCDRSQEEHQDGACPVASVASGAKGAPGREVSALRCVKCDGVVERSDVAGVRVWFCPACAWRFYVASGKMDEAAGIRGTAKRS